MKKISFLIVVLLILISCRTIPITGRKTINFIPDSQALPMAFSQYDTFLKEHTLSDNIVQTQQIKDVGVRISKAVDKFMYANNMKKEADAYRWEFNLIDEPTVNAWCMPGGKVVFYTGIMPICNNDDAVAAVMGHEIAHAFAKHGQERMSQGLVAQYGGMAIALGTADEPEQTKALWNTAYGVSSQLGMLKYSRVHETEADKLGMVFMIMAGYRAEEAVQVWVRMSQLGGQQPPEFLSTHPSHDTRIANLTAFIPEAKQLAQKYNAN